MISARMCSLILTKYNVMFTNCNIHWYLTCNRDVTPWNEFRTITLGCLWIPIFCRRKTILLLFSLHKILNYKNPYTITSAWSLHTWRHADTRKADVTRLQHYSYWQRCDCQQQRTDFNTSCCLTSKTWHMKGAPMRITIVNKLQFITACSTMYEQRSSNKEHRLPLTLSKCV